MTLTYVEALSLAGDRAKQNDDAFGSRAGYAWVIDGATDLHAEPEMRQASDAAWVAAQLNARLFGQFYDPRGMFEQDLRRSVAFTAEQARRDWDYKRATECPRWKLPIASLLIVTDNQGHGFHGLDLGDSRVFALDAAGAVFVAGGPDDAADEETALAAKQSEKEKPLLRRTETIEMLRRMRGELNQPGSRWTFCLDPACAEHARSFSWTLARPAHILLMTDGFSALVDRYHAYDAGGLVRAALDKGLQELGRELRAIENADTGGDKHPRFKKSDDATALLMRLT